jgi:hypothetical protein
MTLTRWAFLFLFAAFSSAQNNGLRGQYQEQRGLEEQGEYEEGCILNDLTQSSSELPAFAALPSSYSLGFALMIKPDLASTGFKSILRLTDNAVSNIGSFTGFTTRLPGVYLCPTIPSGGDCTSPNQLYLSYLPLNGGIDNVITTPSLVPNTLYRVFITIDRATLQMTMSVLDYFTYIPLLPTTSQALLPSPDLNTYNSPVFAQVPPASEIDNLPPAKAFVGCVAFSPKPKPKPKPAPKDGPKPKPKPPSPKHSAVLQSIVDAEELVDQ